MEYREMIKPFTDFRFLEYGLRIVYHKLCSVADTL